MFKQDKTFTWESLSFWTKLSMFHAQDFPNKLLIYSLRAFSLLQTLSLILANVDITTTNDNQDFFKTVRDFIALFGAKDLLNDPSDSILILTIIIIYLFLLIAILLLDAYRIVYKSYQPGHSKVSAFLLTCHMDVLFYPISLFLLQLLINTLKNTIYSSLALGKGAVIGLAVILLCPNIMLALYKAHFCYCSVKTKRFTSRKNSFHLMSLILLKFLLVILQTVVYTGDDSIQEENMAQQIMSSIMTFFISVAMFMRTHQTLPEYRLCLLKLQIIFETLAIGISVFQLCSLFFDDKGFVLEILYITLPLLVAVRVMTFVKRLEKLVFDCEKKKLNGEEIAHLGTLLKQLNKKLIVAPLDNKFSFLTLRARCFTHKHSDNETFGSQTTNQYETNKFKMLSNECVKECAEKLLERKSNDILTLLGYTNLIVKHFKMYPKAYHLCFKIQNLKLKMCDKIGLFVISEKLQVGLEKIFAQQSEEQSFSYILWQDIAFREAFENFKAQINVYTDLARKFWMLLKGEEPQIHKLVEFGKKLKDKEMTIQRFWDKSLESFIVSHPVLCLIFGVFKASFLNLPGQGKKLIEKYNKLSRNKTLMRAIANIDESKDVTIMISGERSHIGMVMECSKSVTGTFGIEKSKLVGKNVKIIMPQFFQARHDSILIQYYETGRSKMSKGERKLYGKDIEENIFPLILTLSIHFDSEKGIIYTGLIKKIVDLNEYLLVREDDIIDEVSLGLHGLLSIESYSEVPISSICPEYTQIKELIQEEAAKKNLSEFTEEFQTETIANFYPSTYNEDANFAGPLSFIVSSRTFVCQGSSATILTLKPAHHSQNISQNADRELSLKQGSNSRKSGSIARFTKQEINSAKSLRSRGRMSTLVHENDTPLLKKTLSQFNPHPRSSKRQMTENNSAGLTLNSQRTVQPLIASYRSEDEKSSDKDFMSEYFNTSESTRYNRVHSLDSVQLSYTNKRHPDRTRKMSTIVFAALLAICIAMAITAHFLFNESVSVISFTVDVIRTTYERLDALMWVWRFVSVYQTRVINFYPTVWTDMDRYKLVVSVYQETMREANNELLGIMATRDQQSKSLFFKKNINFNLMNQSENLSTVVLDSFSAFNLLIDQVSLFDNKSHAVLFQNQSPEVPFIIQNSANDLLVVSEKTVGVVEQSFVSMVDGRKTLSDSILYVSAVFMALIGVMVAVNTRSAHFKNEKLFKALMTIDSKTIIARIGQYELFDTALEQKNGKLLKEKLSTAYIRSENDNANRVKQYGRISRKYRSSTVFFKKLKEILQLSLLVGVFAAIFFYRNSSSNGLFQKLIATNNRLTVASKARYDYNSIIGIVMDMLTYQNTTTIRNQNVGLQAQQSLDALSSNQFLTNTYFDTETNSYIDPNIEALFKMVVCPYVPEFPGGKTQTNCIKATKNNTIGLLALNMDYYNDLKIYMTQFKNNSSYTSAKAIFATLTVNTTPKFYATVGAYTYMITLMTQIFNNQAAEFLDNELVGFTWEMICLCLLAVSCVWFLHRKVNDDEVISLIVRIIPYQEVISNKILKEVIISLYRERADYLRKVE